MSAELVKSLNTIYQGFTNNMANPIQPLTPIEIAFYERQGANHRFFMRRLVALDIFINIWFLNGLQDETISSHTARASLEGKAWGIFFSSIFNWFSKNHGAKAIAGDTGRAEAIISVEDKTSVMKQ